MKKILSPKEVLVAVITHYANIENYDPAAFASARFIADDGTIELTVKVPASTKKKSLN